MKLVEELKQMVIQAHDACLSEAMHCPWCGEGYISAELEKHEKDCPWRLMSGMNYPDTRPPSSN